MNAGPGLERLIADWLVEEAPGRAPDRILDAAGQVIDSTRQRRFVAEWREPMYVTLRGLVAAAAVVVVVVAGVAFATRGETTGTPDPTPTEQPTPTAAPSPSPTLDAQAQLSAYREARNAICDAFWVIRNQHDAAYDWDRLYDPSLAETDRAAMADALEAYGTAFRGYVSQIAALDAPATMAAEAAVAAARQRDTIELIQRVVDLLRAGDLAGAQAVDLATDPLSAGIETFEQRYGLKPCP